MYCRVSMSIVFLYYWMEISKWERVHLMRWVRWGGYDGPGHSYPVTGKLCRYHFYMTELLFRKQSFQYYIIALTHNKLIITSVNTRV